MNNLKKIPLRVYFMLMMTLILGIAGAILIVRIITNHQFVTAYAKGEYLVEEEATLLSLNVPESYLPYYNLGNVAYEGGDYNSAIGYYSHALALFPVGQKECDVRINLALSMCYSIDFQHLESQDKVDTALLILYKASMNE